MKKLLLLAALAVTFVAGAQTTFTHSNLKFETNSDDPGTVTVTGATADAGTTVAIPESVTDGSRQYSVTRIASSAFKGSKTITSVEIPKSVVCIGDDAFYNCTALTYLYLGAQADYEYTHRTRGDKYSFAFYNIGRDSEGLTLEIGPEVKSIEYYLFGQSRVTALKFSAGSQCEEIDASAFYTAPIAGVLDLPESLHTIGASAFFKAKVSTLRVPRGVTSVGTQAFSQIDGLSHVEWNAEAAEVGAWCFVPYRGSTPTFEVTFGPDVRVIPAGLFNFNGEAYYGAGLSSITWPAESKIEEIGELAFAGHIHLTGPLALPASVRKVGAGAFADCTGLTSATLHSGIEELGIGVLERCSGITSLVYDVPRGAAPFGDGIAAPDRSVDHPVSVTVGPAVKLIPDNFLAYFSDVPLEVNLAGATSLEAIGDYAFHGCSNIKFDALRFLDGFRSIGQQPFSGHITADVRIPESMEQVSLSTFSSLTATSLSWGSNTFTHLGGLTIQGPLTIESNVTAIAPGLFSGRGITSLTFAGESALKSISEKAFEHTAISGHLALPDGVTEIGAEAFKECAGLTALTIPAAIDSISSSAFSGCENIAGELVLPEGLRVVGDKAFYGCKAIDGTLTIPASVAAIGGSSFDGTAISSLVVEDTPETLAVRVAFNSTGSWIIKAPASRATAMGPGLPDGQFCNVNELYLGRNISYLCGAMYDMGVTRYYFSPFNGFTRFDRVTLSRHCDTLLPYMFAGKDDCVLSELVVESQTPPAVDPTTFALIDHSKCRLVVPQGSEAAYAADPEWKKFLAADAIRQVAATPDRTIVSIHTLRGIYVGTSLAPLPRPAIYLIRYSDSTTSLLPLK